MKALTHASPYQPRQAGSYASSATYHPNGSLAGLNYGNGMIHSRTLNTRGLPSRIRDRKGSLSRLDYAYGYDKNGNVTSIVDYTSPPYWNESRYLAYDARDRMTQATAPNIFDGELYNYDPLDNVRRMGVFPNGLGGYLQDYYYTYSTSNQRLDRINEANGSLEWDFDHNDLGETTSRTSSYLGATWNYQWNAAGRMVRAERTAPGNRVAYPLMPIAELSSRFASWLSPDGLRQNAPSAAQTTSETYVYDARGHRTRSSRDDGSTRYQVYSRAGQLLYVEDAIDYKRIDYIHLGGKLIAQRSRPLYSSTATVTYHHTDAIQSANVETNTAGNQTERTIRMPYGAPYDGLYREGPGYAGHVTDTQTNLTYMQQRYYDPVALRFLSPDPVDVSASDGGNFNRYWYANNNPYRYVDPDGRFVQALWGVPIGAAIDIIAQKATNWDRPIDWTSVGVSALAGGVTGGVASVARVAAIRATITVGESIAYTAVGSGAAGAGASALDSVAHGESPDGQKMLISAIMNAGVSSAAAGAGVSGLIKEKMAAAAITSPRGIGGTILQTTASSGGSTTSAVQGAASATGRVTDIARDAAAATAQKRLEDELR